MNALRAYGVNEVSSIDPIWLKNPDVFIMLIEEKDTGLIVGGARIQLAHEEVPLPIETAIGHIDPKIKELIQERIPGKTGEFCGLWNLTQYAGFGIGSITLGRMGVSLITQLGMGSCFAFASITTTRNCYRIGFKPIDVLKNQGVFFYPTDQFKTHALLIDDPEIVSHAAPHDRERIFSLRNEPIQCYYESGAKGKILVEYNMIVEGL
ncbi:MAG: hypothetical protein K6T34_05760 [Thermoflavifilum sp.]|nr:hypothetical protein [Thermoflavifilum sp.]